MGFRPDIHAAIERTARLERRKAREQRKAERRQARAQPAPGGTPAIEGELPVTDSPNFTWTTDDFVDAAGNPPPVHDDTDLTGFKLKPEAAERMRAGWATMGYTPEVLDDILSRPLTSADAFLEMINRAIRKQRALRYGANA